MVAGCRFTIGTLPVSLQVAEACATKFAWATHTKSFQKIVVQTQDSEPQQYSKGKTQFPN